MEKRHNWVEIGSGKDGTVYRSTDEPSLALKNLNKASSYNGCSIRRYDAVNFEQESSYINRSNRSKLKMAKIISNLRLYNLVKIYEICGYGYFSKDDPYYYMEYYEPVLTNRVDKNGKPIKKLLIDFPLEYIIRNYYSFEETLNEMWKNGVVIGDLFHENYICTKDRIVLIDIDSYNKLKVGDRIRDKIGIETHSYKYDAYKIFKNFIRESIELSTDVELISPMDFERFYTNPEYSFIDDIQKYDPNMTLRDYLKLKKKELNKNYMRK